jgi:thioesterase domain-containing protein/acyl carrier protein
MPPQAPELSSQSLGRSAADVREWLVGEIARALKVDPAEIDPAAPIDSHGIDSLAAISITGKLSSWLGRNLPATLMWDCPTIDSVAAKLADTDAPPPLPPGVVPFQIRGNRTPIFFFPGVGGHPVTFAPLATVLGASQPSYGLLSPGLDGHGEPLSRVEDIAAAMVSTLRKVRARGPYQLAGYSFGGLLAYEAARQLTQAGESVSMLAIYDTFAPGGRTPRPAWQRLALHGYFLLAQSGRWAYFRDRLSRLQRRNAADPAPAAPESSNSDQPSPARVERIQKLNQAAGERYQPGPYSGAAIWFPATDRQSYNAFYAFDPSGGWGRLCAGGVRVCKLPGSHFTMLDKDHAPGAAEVLRPFLASPRAA